MVATGSVAPVGEEDQSLGATRPDEKLPAKIDLRHATEINPTPAAPVQLDPLSEAGVNLAKIVLGIIASVLVVLFLILAVNEFYTPQYLQSAYSAAVNGPATEAGANAAAAAEILSKITDARNTAREFWLKLAQLVLLNLLLPVLTAILGYIFGSKQASKVS